MNSFLCLAVSAVSSQWIKRAGINHINRQSAGYDFKTCARTPSLAPGQVPAVIRSPSR